MIYTSCDRLRQHGVDSIDRILITRVSMNLIAGECFENLYNVPLSCRAFRFAREVFLAGHLVCGWVNGLFPDGDWCIW